MKKYTRKELIEICEKAFVDENKWKDRDTESSQCQLGECYALLRAGCDFKVTYKDTTKDTCCVTTDRTIWLYVYSKGFMWFEDWGEDRDNSKEEHHYYLPTLKRLEEANGGDWY